MIGLKSAYMDSSLSLGDSTEMLSSNSCMIISMLYNLFP